MQQTQIVKIPKHDILCNNEVIKWFCKCFFFFFRNARHMLDIFGAMCS